MSTQEEARKLMVEQRQHAEQVQEKMLSRTHEEVEKHTDKDIEEEARELITKERQDSEQAQEKILSRTTEEIN